MKDETHTAIKPKRIPTEYRKKRNRLAVANKRRQLKIKSVEYKGGKCEVCGYNKCIAALTFHHKDPNEKEFGIAQSGIPRKFEFIKNELDKCMILCSNCHAELHHQENENILHEKKRLLLLEKEEYLKNGKIVSSDINKARSKIPTKEKLIELVSSKTNKEICDIYDVGYQTVSKWCKKYGISVSERNTLIQNNKESGNKET